MGWMMLDGFSKPVLGTIDRSLFHFTLGLGLRPSGGHSQPMPGSVTAGVSILGDGESSIMFTYVYICLPFDIWHLTDALVDCEIL